MENYKLRVCVEASLLEIKCNDLRYFIEGDITFDKLPKPEKHTLRAQLDIMEAYLSILNSRMSNFYPSIGGAV